MYITCLDMEGVLTPEIWIAFSEASGIPELRRTTRDEPEEIQDVIATVDPLPGAKEFLDELRSITQAVILSDTFTQFAQPLMRKLGWPALFCNELVVAPNGEVTDFRLRCKETKLSTVRAFQSVGYDTIAAGDSFNDLKMIQASKAGFLFRAPESIKAQFPEIPSCEDFDELLRLIKDAMV